MGDKVMNKVNEKLNTMDTNIDAYLFYDHDALNQRAMQEQSFNEGMEQGLQKGIEQGIEQGANQKEEEIIKTMLSNGLSPSKIHEITNIPLDIIEKLVDC